jgi:hypothetical protein
VAERLTAEQVSPELDDDQVEPNGRRLRNRESIGMGSRSQTTPRKRLRKLVRQHQQPDLPPVSAYGPRPRTWGECLLAEAGPCPWVSCAHHLYLDVGADGSLKINFPDREPWELEETCALDVAEEGGVTLDAIGALLNVTRERVRQIEVRLLRRLKAAAAERGLRPEVETTHRLDRRDKIDRPSVTVTVATHERVQAAAAARGVPMSRLFDALLEAALNDERGQST